MLWLILQDGQVRGQQINLLTPHLESAMKDDEAFAQAVRQLASEINQEITIGQILGENVQNVYGGSAVQLNDPTFSQETSAPSTLPTVNWSRPARMDRSGQLLRRRYSSQ